MSTRLLARVAATVGALAVAMGATVGLASSSLALPPGSEIDYTTTGGTTLTNPNSQVSVTFKPVALRTFVQFHSDETAGVQAFLPIAPVRASFKAYGFLPATGTVAFTQVGPITGTLGIDTGNGVPLHVYASYVVSLRDVYIGGRAAHVGGSCQTINPIHAAVHALHGFNLSTGDLTGTYTLGEFFNCGAAQDIINDTLPGTGNVLNLHIQFGSPSSDDARTARAR